MKKTVLAIAMMTLILTGTTWAQRQKNFGSTAMGGGSGVGVRNRRPAPRSLYANNIGQGVHAEPQDGSGTDNANRRRPNAIGNPFGLGGTVTAGVKNRQSANLGDTATHEVGHKGKSRRGAIGEGASDVNARHAQPRKPQNLLPYMEQSNVRRQTQRQGFWGMETHFGAGENFRKGKNSQPRPRRPQAPQ
ncbi:MAG: hypothetical protein U0Y68_26655 [Blastocatellia bacterium]